MGWAERALNFQQMHSSAGYTVADGRAFARDLGYAIWSLKGLLMTSKLWDILGLGCVAVDDLLYVPSFPAADTKVQVLKRERQCGGLTGTALVTASRLGAKCAFAGRFGLDELARVIEENFRRENVDASFAPRTKDAPVPHSIIIGRGTRNIFYWIEGRIGADDLLPDESVIRSARVLFIDQYGVAGNLRAASIARAAGISIVADFEECHDRNSPNC
jgi:sulfofructose kinase